MRRLTVLTARTAVLALMLVCSSSTGARQDQPPTPGAASQQLNSALLARLQDELTRRPFLRPTRDRVPSGQISAWT